jgi:hypothetical protein
VFNVLDKKYFDPGRPKDPEDAIQQDGRSFRMQVTARFLRSQSPSERRLAH